METQSPLKTSTAWKREFLPQVGGGTALVVKASNNTSGTLDHTWQEIADAPMAWLEVANEHNGWDKYPLVTVGESTIHGETDYAVGFSSADGTTIFFIAESANGYPTQEQS